MKNILISIILGTFACAYPSKKTKIEELLQTKNPTVLIENWRLEPIIFHIKSNTRLDSLGVVEPSGGRKCFEIKYRQKVIISFEYENIVYQTPPFNPEYYAGGHRLVIRQNPKEDVLLIEPSTRCKPDENYKIF